MKAEPSWETLSKVAVTSSSSVPVALPAVYVMVAPLVEFRVPRELPYWDQAKVVPAGHGPPEHDGVAVNAAFPPVGRVVMEGLTETDSSVPPLPVGEMTLTVPAPEFPMLVAYRSPFAVSIVTNLGSVPSVMLPRISFVAPLSTVSPL